MLEVTYTRCMHFRILLHVCAMPDAREIRVWLSRLLWTKCTPLGFFSGDAPSFFAIQGETELVLHHMHFLIFFFLDRNVLSL